MKLIYLAIVLLLFSKNLISQNYSFNTSESKKSDFDLNIQVLLGNEIVASNEYIVRVIDYVDGKTDTLKLGNKFSIKLKKNRKFRIDVYYKGYGGETLIVDTYSLKGNVEFENKILLYPNMIEYVSGYIFFDEKSKTFTKKLTYPLDMRWAY